MQNVGKKKELRRNNPITWRKTVSDFGLGCNDHKSDPYTISASDLII